MSSSLNDVNSNSTTHRPFVVDVVDEYNDDDEEEEYDVDDMKYPMNHIIHGTTTQEHNLNLNTTTATNDNRHSITAITTTNNDEPPVPAPSTKQKLKFWFLSDQEDDNKNDISSSSSSQQQPVSSPFHDHHHPTTTAVSTALTVLPSSPRTLSQPHHQVILPKNLVHETIHKQRNMYYQQLHDIELRTSQINADLAQEIMDFDQEIQSCQEQNVIYHSNRTQVQQMDLYTFLKTETATTTNHVAHDTTTTATATSSSSLLSSSTPTTTATTSATATATTPTTSATTTLQSMSSSSNKNWMMYEQRMSSLDAQMTHAVHVQLSDLNNQQIHQTIHDIVYTKIPQLLQQETQDYYTKQEHSLMQQWESIVGVMARRYAEERATRIVSYQTILDQIQSLHQQFQAETKKLMTLHSKSSSDNEETTTIVDIATMNLMDPHHPTSGHSTAIVEVTPHPTHSTTTTSNSSSTITTLQLYHDIQVQIRQLHQHILQEQQIRHEHDEQVRALLLHRTELLQQAILETFE